MDTITIPRRQVPELLGAIEEVSAAIKDPDFRLVYALHRSRASLQGEVEAITKAQRPSEGYLGYEKDREALCAEYSLLENGEPKLQLLPDGRQTYVMDPAREPEFRERVAALRSERLAVIQAEEARRRDIDLFFAEPVEVRVHRFPVGWIKAKELNARQMIQLMPLFTDAERAAGAESDQQAA